MANKALNQITIGEAFPIYDETNYKGIFTAIANITGFDLWDTDTAKLMDLEYLNGFSGLKVMAPLMWHFHYTDNEISTADLAKVANLLYAKYKTAWSQYKEYLEADYDLYDDVDDETVTRTPNLTTESAGGKADNEVETNEQVYGFDSSSPADSNKTTSKASHKDTTTQTGTESVTTHRAGSSRLYTGGEMLGKDHKFWDNFNFFTEIFKDVDAVIALGIYEDNGYGVGG